jgi:superfamily II DNA or RNA helicase
MLPRPYQSRLVDRAEAALKKHGNTLAVAATGAGKTLMLAWLAARVRGQRLIIQHRQELVNQNLTKYRKVNPDHRVSLFTSDVKSWRGDAVFAMAQTLVKNLAGMPRLGMIVVDEAHHIAASTWSKIIEAAKEKNPGVLVAGFTATPERGDKKSLRGTFNNVCDAVTIRELVQLGFLVPPKAFVIDVQRTQEKLRELGKVSDYFDQDEVEKILNTVAVNAEVVRHWRERAGNRRTIVFCATVQHAQDVAKGFRDGGISSACVHGSMATHERQDLISRFNRGEIQVLTNVMVLTEGFDSPPTSCVVLLRKCSNKGPLIQMVGRGLRTVNPEECGVIKKDCVILDFGTSLLTHGDLNMSGALREEREHEAGEAQTKLCPEATGGCGAELPSQTRTCPLCGYVFESESEGNTVTQVELTELEILSASPFRYVDLFDSGRAMMASGFDAWAAVFSIDGENWQALGKVKAETVVHRVQIGDRLQALAAADDFLRMHETDSAAKKTKGWLDQPATLKQIELLSRFGYELPVDVLGQSGWTKYLAACHANFQFSRRLIESALGVAA